jgi:hypothetical protein
VAPRAASAFEKVMPRQIYPFIHGNEDVYDLAAPLTLDLQGWASTHPIFEKTIETLRPELIVEVGTWKGASAVHMAKLLHGLEFDGESSPASTVFTCRSGVKNG